MDKATKDQPLDPHPMSVGPVLNGGYEDLLAKMPSPEKSALGSAPNPRVHKCITRGGPEVVAQGDIDQNGRAVQGPKELSVLGFHSTIGLEEASTGDGPLGQVALASPQHTARLIE
jgi:hypothetical protein